MTRLETALDQMVAEADMALDIQMPSIERMLATPTGAALAALVEAAEDWLEAKVSTGHATVDLERAVIAWLATTEETRDAR